MHLMRTVVCKARQPCIAHSLIERALWMGLDGPPLLVDLRSFLVTLMDLAMRLQGRAASLQRAGRPEDRSLKPALSLSLEEDIARRLNSALGSKRPTNTGSAAKAPPAAADTGPPDQQARQPWKPAQAAADAVAAKRSRSPSPPKEKSSRCPPLQLALHRPVFLVRGINEVPSLTRMLAALHGPWRDLQTAVL